MTPAPAEVLALAEKIRDHARANGPVKIMDWAEEIVTLLASRASQEERYTTFVKEPQATYTHGEVEALLNEVSNRFRKAHLEHVLRDRASQEERIREDERGLRGKVVYPCASFRNDDEFRDPDGYVIVKAERAAASEGRPGPKYYTLVSDTGDVRTLLSTLFTRDPDRARLRGDAS